MEKVEISVLVPVSLGSQTRRTQNWNWLERYWRANLPEAEFIIGQDEAAAEKLPFSKSVAVNNAVSKSRGEILAIVDADAYLPIQSVLRCAKEIKLAKRRGYKLWFVPYRRLYRLTEEASDKILASDPAHPLEIPSPPPDGSFSNITEHQGTPVSAIGHWYGAMAQIMSREAFDFVGGWDTRFKGWGGEDHAAMVATDTLYTPHKTLPGPIFHLWHPTFTPTPSDDRTGKKRLWANQPANHTNDALSGRYYYSRGNPKRMRSLVDEFKTGQTAPVSFHKAPPNLSE